MQANITITLLLSKKTAQSAAYYDCIAQPQKGGYEVVAGENNSTTIAAIYPEMYAGQTCYVYMQNSYGEYSIKQLDDPFEMNQQTKTFALPANMCKAGKTTLVFHATIEGVKTVWLPVVIPINPTGVDYNAIAPEEVDAVAELLEELRKVEQEITKEEETRKEAEQGRVDAESARVEAEAERAEAEATRNTAEQSRVEAEDGRTTAESSRRTAEEQRAESEQTRASNEEKRAEAETKRDAAETDRATAENLRAEVEGRRNAAEADRARAETQRNLAEEVRNSAEITRQSAETKRTESETNRALAEADRVVAEKSRDAAEKLRSDSESLRNQAEAQRVTAETARDTAESKRATAESARDTAEQGRADAEQKRAGAEDTRAENEADRVLAEKQRAIDETNRQSKEDERQQAETDRQKAEKSRADAEAARSSAEAQRQAHFETAEKSETARVEAEANREKAEVERNAAEQTRASAEATRNTAEQSRVEAEDGRTTAESSRRTAEEQRAESEQTRASNEEKRAEAEQTRSTEEAKRATAESQRATAETARDTAESKRATAESARDTAEQGRADAEQKRAGAEDTRAENEAQRQSNEAARQQAETDRQTNEDTRQESYQEAAKKAGEAVSIATKALENSEMRSEEYYTKEQVDKLIQGEPITRPTGKIYGVSGMGNVNPVWRRTYDAAGVTLTLENQDGDESLVDFVLSDTAMMEFFRFQETTDDKGNVFIIIPPLSFRYDRINNNEVEALSVKLYEDGDEAYGYELHPAFKKWTSNTEFEGYGSIQIAKYMSSALDETTGEVAENDLSDRDPSEIKVRSVSGEPCDKSWVQWNEGLAMITATDPTYRMLHWSYRDVIVKLASIFFARADIYDMLGVKAGDNMDLTSGTTDEITTACGYNRTSGQIKLFGIDAMFYPTNLNGVYQNFDRTIKYTHLLDTNPNTAEDYLNSSLVVPNFYESDLPLYAGSVTKISVDENEHALGFPSANLKLRSEHDSGEEGLHSTYYCSRSRDWGIPESRGQIYAFQKYIDTMVYPEDGLFFVDFNGEFWCAWGVSDYDGGGLRLCKDPS